MSWKEFYEWLEKNNYDVVRNSNIFRYDMFVTSFDPLEDFDSGEIEETIERIKENDYFNFN
jgi:hypothetical protein